MIDRERLVQAILRAAEEDTRRTSDRFEWYASADEMAEAIADEYEKLGDES